MPFKASVLLACFLVVKKGTGVTYHRVKAEKHTLGLNFEGLMHMPYHHTAPPDRCLFSCLQTVGVSATVLWWGLLVFLERGLELCLAHRECHKDVSCKNKAPIKIQTPSGHSATHL